MNDQILDYYDLYGRDSYACGASNGTGHGILIELLKYHDKFTSSVSLITMSIRLLNYTIEMLDKYE